jgi:NTE family protein
LRALHEHGVLTRVDLLSSVSGGSVIAGLYCTIDGDFAEFEKRTREILARGLLLPSVVTALTSLEAVKAILVFLPLLVDRSLALLAGILLKLIGRGKLARGAWFRGSPILRSASRTTILRGTFSKIYQGRKLSNLRADRPRLIVVACELRAKAAFYFTKAGIHCWRYGDAEADGIEIADAVAASAAYPAALPAIDRIFTFRSAAGESSRHRVLLTDGGVYDNLGLAPFWPGRDPNVGLAVPPVNHIIVCRAGYGLGIEDAPSFFPSRMAAAFNSVFARAQNSTMGRLFDLRDARRLDGFTLAYLGQDDAKLGDIPADFISRDAVADYPTDFSAMSADWIDLLSGRGEKLMKLLLERSKFGQAQRSPANAT